MSKSGPTSFGYRREGDQLVLDVIEAPIRIRMFELFLIHQRKKTVAEILNAEDKKTRNGSYFSGQTIGRLISEKTVIGIPGKVEPLISKDLFDKCQNILKSQNKKGGINRLPMHLFAGILYCGCGGKMYVPTASKKYVCRACRSKVLKTDLAAVYVETFIGELKKHKPNSNLIDIYQAWPTLSLRDKVGLLELTTERVEINNNKVTITIIIL